MTLTTEYLNKIRVLLELGISHTEYIRKDYVEQDIIFLSNAYEEKFNHFLRKFRLSKEFDLASIREEISEFESALFVWTESLPYKSKTDGEGSNSLYSTLYAVLEGMDTLLEECLVDIQDSEVVDEDDEDEEHHYITDREDITETTVDETHFDEDDYDDVERCFPD